MNERAPRRLNSEALWEYALRALAGRAHSAGDLRQKLERRAERAGDVAGILVRLKDCGYLDDKRYAEAVASWRLDSQGLGKARTLSDLRKKRVAPAVAEKAVAKVYSETDEVALVEAFLRRKYRSVALDVFLAEPKNLASAYRRLRVAGFSSGNSLRVLKRFAREPELLDGLEDEGGRGEE
ncbi:MAG TPA: regulatory protein RecX [Bryobacteraceae bacterium]|nr:regulatory protein RecX [Bryobacteraceae bacterium]